VTALERPDAAVTRVEGETYTFTDVKPPRFEVAPRTTDAMLRDNGVTAAADVLRAGAQAARVAEIDALVSEANALVPRVNTCLEPLAAVRLLEARHDFYVERAKLAERRRIDEVAR
jgi:hypothetical protein